MLSEQIFIKSYGIKCKICYNENDIWVNKAINRAGVEVL